MNKDEFFKLKPVTPGYSPSLNSYLLLQSAEEANCEIEYVEGSDYFIIGKGNLRRTLRIDYNKISSSYHAGSILIDKYQTCLFLNRSGISTARGEIVSVNDDIIVKVASLKRPLVAKPYSGTDGGCGVCLDLKTDEEILHKVNSLLSSGSRLVLIEEQFEGKEFRILATHEKLLAVTHRVPANVIGDGTSSIRGLISTKNADINRGGHDYQKPLLKIEIDDDLIKNLKDQNLTIESVPDKDQQIFMRKTSNLSMGGDSIDITDEVHPDIAKIAVDSIKAIPELAYAGIDIMTQDITKPQDASSYVILEMNSSPMISMHHFPYQGKSRDVAKEIINLVFSETAKNGR